MFISVESDDDERYVSLWINGSYHGEHGYIKPDSLDEDIKNIAEMAVGHLMIKSDDLYGSKEYKRYIICEEIDRVIRENIKKAGGAA